MKKLLFSVENVKEIFDSEDPNFCNVSMDLFASGPNLHQMPVSEDVLLNCSESIYDVPIVYKIDPWTDDLGGHDPEEQICGFIGRANNPITFRKLSDGRLMMSALGKIWKRYSGKLIDILKRDGGKKAVSVEMEVLDFDEIKSEIKSFAMRAVTIIGVEPAIPDAQLTVLSFAKDKENYYKAFEPDSKKTYKIDLSRDAAFMEDIKWRNEGRVLYSKILTASNAEALAEACYLIVETGWKDAPSTKLKYPVCKWRGDTLCLAKSGLEAANSRLQAQGTHSGEAYDKLKKYYKRLGLSMENFSTNFEVKEDEQLEEKVMMQEPEKVEDIKEDEKPTEDQPKEKEDFAVTVANYEAKIAEYEAKMKDFEAKIEQYACGEKAFQTEIEDLKAYKNRREEEDKKFAVEKLMSDVSEYLPKEKMDEFAEEAKEVKPEEFAAFANKVQAVSFSYAKKTGKETVTDRMSVQLSPEVEKKSVWGF